MKGQQYAISKRFPNASAGAVLHHGGGATLMGTNLRRRGIWNLALGVAAAAGIVAAAPADADKVYSVLRAGDLPGLRKVLENRLSPNWADSRQVTPLMYAAEVGSVEAMSILIDQGAEINAQNAFGSTALMWSATDPRKVRLLLEHGAEVNKVAKSGRTALMIASLSSSSADVVRVLLARGAGISAADRNGLTPLLAAAAGNDTASVQMLVEAGADVNHSGAIGPNGPNGFTPLMLAAGNGNLQVVKLLLAKGAKVNAMSDRADLPRVKNGVVSAGGFTPLLLASTYGPPEVVKALLDAGADVNVADVRGMTPLVLALTTDRFNPEIVKLLRTHGADDARKTTAGLTALDWAHKLDDDRAFTALGAEPPRRAAVAVGLTGLTDPRLAVARSIELLESSSATFFNRSGCFACHAQVSADFAVAAARKQGIAVDENAAWQRLQQSTSGLTAAGPAIMERQLAGDGFLYLMEELGRIGHEPDRLTDSLVAAIGAEQGQDGGWHSRLGLARTPLEDSDFSRTALAIRALKTYGTRGRATETTERIEHAAHWLRNAEPTVTEDLAMRLLGLAGAGASPEDMRQFAQPLIRQQRASGGWAQRAEWPSDAYATGMSLWTLAETGMLEPRDPRYRRGVRFLLSTQQIDGSWHVISRAARFQPYFESGFPYGTDQWISMMGTGWAVSALALAIDAQ
jgi:N-acyl-D-amino-acid deacylase